MSVPVILDALAYPLNHGVLGRPGPYLVSGVYWILATSVADAVSAPLLTGYKSTDGLNYTASITGPACSMQLGTTGVGMGPSMVYVIPPQFGSTLDVFYQSDIGDLTYVSFNMVGAGSFGTPSASGINITPGNLNNLAMGQRVDATREFAYSEIGGSVMGLDLISGSWSLAFTISDPSHMDWILDGALITDGIYWTVFCCRGSGIGSRSGQEQVIVFDDTTLITRHSSSLNGATTTGIFGAPFFDQASRCSGLPFVNATTVGVLSALQTSGVVTDSTITVYNFSGTRSNVVYAQLGGNALNHFDCVWGSKRTSDSHYIVEQATAHTLDFDSVYNLWLGPVLFYDENADPPTGSPTINGVSALFINTLVNGKLGIVAGLSVTSPAAWDQALYAWTPAIPPAAPSFIWLIKQVIGGTATNADWTLTATGPATIALTGDFWGITAVPPGTYTFTESAGPVGYTAGTWLNALNGTPIPGGVITLLPGQAVYGLIENRFGSTPNGSEELPFMDTFSHYQDQLSIASKWTGPLEFETAGFALSHRPLADPNEQCLELAAGNHMYKALTPGSSHRVFGMAWQTQFEFGGTPLEIIHEFGPIAGFHIRPDGHFSGTMQNANALIQFSLQMNLYDDTGALVNTTAGVVSLANQETFPSSFVISLRTWYYLELIAIALPTTAGIGNFYFLRSTPPGGSRHLIAAPYTTLGKTIGPIYPSVLYANADGATNDGVPFPAAPTWGTVTERPPAASPNNDTDYFELVNVGDTQFCEVDDIVGNPVIWGVQAVVIARKNAAGPAAYQMILRNGAGTEHICTLAPGETETDWYPSYSPDTYDYSRMTTRCFRFSPFTGVAWTKAEVNATQIGVRKVTPQKSTAGVNLVMTSAFETFPFAHWSGGSFSLTALGRHANGFFSNGGVNDFIGAGDPDFNFNQLTAGASINQTADGGGFGVTSDIRTFISGSQTFHVQTDNCGLLYLEFGPGGSLGTFGPALQTISARHHYFLEVTGQVSGALTFEGWVYLNGQMVLHGIAGVDPHIIPYTGLYAAYMITPGGGNTLIMDDFYVNQGEFLSDGRASPGDAYIVAPDPGIRVTWMGLEVVQGMQIPVAISLKCPPSTIQAGVPYSGFFIVTGGVPPFTFAIIAGSLPTGLSLNASTGEVSGTPTTNAAFSYTGQVTDSQGNMATATCAMAPCVSGSSKL